MSTVSPLHHGHGNGGYSTNSPAPGASHGVAARDTGIVSAAADSTVRSGSVPASGSGSAPGSASGSIYGDSHAHHTAHHHHHPAHHTHSHSSMTSPVNAGHSSSWSPYGYPSAPVYGASPSAYGHAAYGHNAYSQYASGYGYASNTGHHIATAPTTPVSNGTNYHPSVNGMMMHHGQHPGYGYNNHHLGSHTPTHAHNHSSAYFMNNDGTHSHLNGAAHMPSQSYNSAPQYSTQLPLAGRHRVTTTLWEDEGTLCFQVDARGVCVARRHDNNMINGTKLLNVCGMSRGKRDGILKNEKERIVVKVGAMHLKGVWISFARAKQLAEQNGIAEALYPLFEPNIQSFLYHPDNYPRTAAVIAAAQERHTQRQRVPGMPSMGGTGATQAPPLMRANTTPINADGFVNSMSTNNSWTGTQEQSHPASTTSQQSPNSMQSHGTQAAHMQLSLSGHSATSPTYTSQPQQQQHQHQQHYQHQQSQHGQYPMTQAQQLARPPSGDRRHSDPVTLNNIHDHPGHPDNHATNMSGANGNSASGVNGVRKLSGLKRSWNDSEDLHASTDVSPSEREMQRSGSGGSTGYKLEGNESDSPDTSDDRMSKKSKLSMQQRGGMPMEPTSGNMLMGVGSGNELYRE